MPVYSKTERGQPFVAFAEDGREFTVYTWFKVITIIGRGKIEQAQRRRDLVEMQTADGHLVRKDRDGEFSIPDLDNLKIFSTDPNAP